MNDPKLLRSEPEKARRGLQARGGRHLPDLDALLEADERHRALIREAEELRARQNAASKEIGKAKAAKDEAAAARVMAEVAELKTKCQESVERSEEAGVKVRNLALGLPNLPHESVPPGKSEADNKTAREGPRPAKLPFKPLGHAAIGEKLGLMDFEAGARLAGSRFAVLKGPLARLERALGQFMIDLHTKKNGYVEMWVPYIVRPEIMEGTGQLPKFAKDLYPTGQEEERTQQELDSEKEVEPGNLSYSGHYLIPTAEVPLTNLVREQILDAQDLPLKFTALTPCFRQEAGSYGKDVKGLIRNHQFDKVELVWIAKPEDSMAALEKLTADAEGVLKELGLPYRVIELCAADLGFASCKTYDLEVWFPGEGRYREISSCSNCWDFQARRMNARFRRDAKSPPELAHTLNGSGVAVGRLLAAILENFQREDGSVSVPEPLRPYFEKEAILASGGTR